MSDRPDDAPAPPRRSGEVTRLLREASTGNREAFDRLVPLVYDELYRIAANRMRAEPAGHTLTPTALVNEAYLQLAQQDRVEWRNRSHFFAIAAQAMRRVLINHARARHRKKRGGEAVRVDLEALDLLPDGVVPVNDDNASELIALDDALHKLHAFNEAGAEVVEYRFFGGLGFREIAEVQGVSEITVRRRWTAARAWLRGQLSDDSEQKLGVLLATVN